MSLHALDILKKVEGVSPNGKLITSRIREAVRAAVANENGAFVQSAIVIFASDVICSVRPSSEAPLSKIEQRFMKDIFPIPPPCCVGSISDHSLAYYLKLVSIAIDRALADAILVLITPRTPSSSTRSPLTRGSTPTPPSSTSTTLSLSPTQSATPPRACESSTTASSFHAASLPPIGPRAEPPFSTHESSPSPRVEFTAPNDVLSEPPHSLRTTSPTTSPNTREASPPEPPTPTRETLLSLVPTHDTLLAPSPISPLPASPPSLTAATSTTTAPAVKKKRNTVIPVAESPRPSVAVTDSEYFIDLSLIPLSEPLRSDLIHITSTWSKNANDTAEFGSKTWLNADIVGSALAGVKRAETIRAQRNRKLADHIKNNYELIQKDLDDNKHTMWYRFDLSHKTGAIRICVVINFRARDIVVLSIFSGARHKKDNNDYNPIRSVVQEICERRERRR